MPDSAVVIGGGFYGARIASLLRAQGLHVVLLERAPVLLSRASYVNQARVHNGYHYPRSVLTALRARVHYRAFVDEFADAVDGTFETYYAIARHGSKVAPTQFERFCRHIDAPVAPAPRSIAALFDRRVIESVYAVTECAFDAVRLRRIVERRLAAEGVDVRVGAEVTRIEPATAESLEVTYRTAEGEHGVVADLVINCTYSRLNHVLRCAGADPVPLRHELTEMALVEMPSELARLGITVMDGPFFSAMPFPAAGMHTLSHVRYTPHASWEERASRDCPDGDALLAAVRRSSNAERMLRDAARFVPVLAEARYRGSLWEVKTVLPQSEHNDSRPILLSESSRHRRLLSVLGAKIDSVYDVEASLRDRFVSEALTA